MSREISDEFRARVEAYAAEGRRPLTRDEALRSAQAAGRLEASEHARCPRLGVELYPGRWAKSARAYGHFLVVTYYPTSRPR